MVFTAEVCARHAEADRTNVPGTCLMSVRTWCGIGARYPDAATAWRNANDRHVGDRTGPRGSVAYWVGGSRGFGHIALNLGGGLVRSTDAGGSGIVATRSIGWFDDHWPRDRYAGWAWDINEVTIPHPAQAPSIGNWGRVRRNLYAVLNSDAAKSVSKDRDPIIKFLRETRRELDALPKR